MLPVIHLVYEKYVHEIVYICQKWATILSVQKDTIKMFSLVFVR